MQGRKLLTTLPKALKKAFYVMVLADSAFGSIPFLTPVRRLKLHAKSGSQKNAKIG
jgi:hypothetical protein